MRFKTLVNLTRPYENENGTPGEFGKAESFLSEELSLSPDKTETTASILSITVKTSARVIA